MREKVTDTMNTHSEDKVYKPRVQSTTKKILKFTDY